MSGRFSVGRTIAVVFPEWSRSITGAEHAESPEHSELSHRMFESVVRILAETAATVHVVAPGTALLDARGPCRYFGGEEAVLRRLEASLATVRARGRWGLGVADGRLAALVAARRSARRGGAVAVPVGGSVRHLAPCPVTMLAEHGEIPAETVEVLARLGLTTMAAVARLGERALIDRFGAIGERLHVLVNGADPEPLLPEAAADDLERTVSCDDWPQGDAMSLPRVIAAVHDPCVDLLAFLAGRNQQCVRLRVTVHHDGAHDGGHGVGAVSDRIWHEQRGFTVGAVLDRLRWQLSALSDHEFRNDEFRNDEFRNHEFRNHELRDHEAAVSSVTLGAVGVQQAAAEQQQLWGGRHDHDARAARAVTMVAAFGVSVRITVPEWCGGRDPRSLYREVEAGGIDLRDAEGCRQRVTRGRGSARDWTGSLPRPLPVTVHRVPREAAVRDATGAPVLVDGRHVLSSEPATLTIEGAVHGIDAWAGPWPVEERWWDPPRRRRMVRMQVRTGESVHLLQLERSQWTVVARYD